MALKNAYSKIPTNRIFELLQKTLSAHGARQVMFDYGEGGKVTGMAFTISYNDKLLPIKLPAQIEKAGQLLREQGFRYDDDQIYRVAWRNILDWVDAQMAFIDIGQVKLEQVFLPYMTDNLGRTFFETLQDTGFLLPRGN